MRRPFGAWEVVSGISYWLMLWVIAESCKLKKTKVLCNLVGAKSLEGLGTLGRLGLEGLLLFRSEERRVGKEC